MINRLPIKELISICDTDKQKKLELKKFLNYIKKNSYDLERISKDEIHYIFIFGNYFIVDYLIKNNINIFPIDSPEFVSKNIYTASLSNHWILINKVFVYISNNKDAKFIENFFGNLLYQIYTWSNNELLEQVVTYKDFNFDIIFEDLEMCHNFFSLLNKSREHSEERFFKMLELSFNTNNTMRQYIINNKKNMNFNLTEECVNILFSINKNILINFLLEDTNNFKLKTFNSFSIESIINLIIEK